MAIEEVKDLNDVRVPYTFRKFPTHVHKFAGAYEDGGHKPNRHLEVTSEEELAAALQAGWSLTPITEAPEGAAAVDETGDDKKAAPAKGKKSAKPSADAQ